MDRNQPPKTMDELIAALADGEIDMRDQPQLLARLSQNEQAASQIASHQQLKHAVGQAMDGPQMKCPDALAAKLLTMAESQSSQTPSTLTDAQAKPVTPAASYHGPPVLARIGRWAPAAVAAVLLVAATAMFIQAGAGPSAAPGMASLLSVSDVERFDSRHLDCAAEPDILKKHAEFGGPGDLEKLPVKLGDYFKTSSDGMSLSLDSVGYDYKLTGVCGIPGSGSVHILYKNHDGSGQAISLWLAPDDGRLDSIESDRVYVEAGKTLDHPVIVWRSGGLIYYLVGDSLEDAHQAVETLRGPA